MNPRKCLKRMFETFVANAVVNKPENQKRANNAFRWTYSHFTNEEISQLDAARSAAINYGKSQKEFKEVCKKIRDRLFS